MACLFHYHLDSQPGGHLFSIQIGDDAPFTLATCSMANRATLMRRASPSSASTCCLSAVSSSAWTRKWGPR